MFYPSEYSLLNAIAKDLNGNIEGAMSEVYDIVESLADKCHYDYDVINGLFSEVYVEAMSEEFLIMLLSVTLPYKWYLPARGVFFDSVSEKIEDKMNLIGLG